VPPYDAEQRIVAHREHQSPGEVCRRTATQRQTEMVDDVIEPSRTPRLRRQHFLVEPFGKNTPPTKDRITIKSSCQDHEPNRTTRRRKIRQRAVIAAGNPFGERPWSVDINHGDFEAALLNLAINARDSMPDGGTLVIETANKVFDEFYVARNPGSSVGEFVMVSVSDTGAGMTPDVVAKAFEPFFTTKEVGKGTGLGLSMVHAFMRRSGGHVTIYSEPGEGTTVHLYLPRGGGGAKDAKGRPAGPAGRFRQEPRDQVTTPTCYPASVPIVEKSGIRRVGSCRL